MSTIEMVAKANDTGSISPIVLVVRRSAAPIVSCSIGGKELFFAQSGWMGASMKLAVVGVREIYPATKRMFSGLLFFAFIGSRP